MDKPLLVIIALFINAVFGGWWQKLLNLLSISHLLDYPAKLLRDIERSLNKANLPLSEIQLRATLLVLTVMSVSYIAGWLFYLIFSSPIFTIIILAIFLPVGSSWQRVHSIKKNLKIGNLPAAREQLNATVFRYHAVMDAPSLARAAIEYLAVQFSEKILSPIFWFIVFGVPGLFMSLAVSLLQETLAGTSSQATSFSKPASNAQFILNYIPVRLAAFLWMIATLFLPNSNWREAAEKISAEITTAPPNQLTVLYAAASLNLSLGGKTSGYCTDRIIGTGKPVPSNADITRAQFLFIIACLLVFISLGLFV